VRAAQAINAAAVAAIRHVESKIFVTASLDATQVQGRRFDET
jgi:hypothetical protein